MPEQPITIPTAEIITDLLIDNWELRWQVLDIFHQTKSRVKNFSQTSPYHRSIAKLCHQIISNLQSENDQNLHTITLAVYFLGGMEQVFRLLKKLDLEAPPLAHEEFKTLQAKILKGNREHTIYDYFLLLFGTGDFPDSALSLSIRFFTSDELVSLFCAISSPVQQALAFDLLMQRYPGTNLNHVLTDNNLALLTSNPRLLPHLKLPLEQDLLATATDMALELFRRQQHLEAAVGACVQLQITSAIPQISALVNDKEMRPIALAALGRLGSEEYLGTLVAAGRSFFSSKKTEAANLLGAYQGQQAIECLKKLANSRNRKIREYALASLEQTGHPQALSAMVSRFSSAATKEKKQILAIIARTRWPNIPESQGERIAAQATDSALAPELFQALEAIGHGALLLETLQTFQQPLKTGHQKTMCLFLGQYAAKSAIRKALLAHLFHPDWGFSYHLLCRMQSHLTIREFPALFQLLELRESHKPLTIKERLELGKGDDEFIPAMCRYLNQHPPIAEQLLFALTNHILTRKPPLKQHELTTIFAGQEKGLQRLVSESPFEMTEVPPENLYILLLFCRYLDEITVDGASCFALVVNLTRRYSGFFSQHIWSIIYAILQAERTTTDTALLPYLDQLLEVLRGRDGVIELRTMALTIKKRIFSMSRDLVVFIESSRYRDLQIFKVEKIHG
ncbi:MAG: hypothetical protein JXO49_00705 [Deltaproteobacteria bacterium]|nr:hypothetical protein [Candidatus Anaeroferrophillus wilburensis]MBN2887845.1 hypothetical protein [Deltaproteobacteria bacterium]